jgi:hypothetical protein
MNGKKPVTQYNRYLKDGKSYKDALIRNVASSSEIEIGMLPEALRKDLKKYDFKSRNLLFNDSSPLFRSPA